MTIADLLLDLLVGGCHGAMLLGSPTESQEAAALRFLDAYEGGVHRGPVVGHHVVRLRTPGDVARFLGLRHVDPRTLN